MFNNKLNIYPTIFLLSMITFPILYFIKKRFFNDSIQKKKEPWLSPEEKYIIKIKEDFDKTYQSESHIEKYNENVDLVFLNKDLYSEILKDSDNELELSWKRRILFDFTPRGNVIMFYNSYKQGFSYYSDQNIPYIILNAVAMKYVILYRCRDFFMDELVVPQKYGSRILELSRVEELDKKKEEKSIQQIDTKSGPFAKFKSYVKPNDPIVVSKNKINLPKNMDFNIKNPVLNKDLMKNKFIYLGKTMNWKILSPIKKNDAMSYPKSNLISSIENNAGVQSKVFSYKNYKLTKGNV